VVEKIRRGRESPACRETDDEDGGEAAKGEIEMRSLMVLVLLAALAAGGFLSKPDADAHRANAEKVLAEQRNEKGDSIGDLIGAVLGQDAGDFEDMVVATKYTARQGGKAALECWGAFSQFLCSTPTQ
jgi:hypothetical protein